MNDENFLIKFEFKYNTFDNKIYTYYIMVYYHKLIEYL